MTTFDPALTAYRLVLANLKNDADACERAMAELNPEYSARVIFQLVHWLSGELEVLAALEPEQEELVTQAVMMSDPDTVRARAIDRVESEWLTPRVIANVEAQFDNLEGG